jgi:hypothetical protein
VLLRSRTASIHGDGGPGPSRGGPGHV